MSIWSTTIDISAATGPLIGRMYWDSAETHRLNQAHWSRVQAGQSINDRISADLPDTRARCIAEGENNGLVDGVIFTHQVDVVGQDGPELQVQSSSNAYNEWLERHWRQWWKAPTPNPRMSGATLLRLWIRALWEKGEILCQKIDKPNAGTPVSMRLQPIDPRRLGTPPGEFGNPWLAEGIEVRPDGEPLWYWIERLDGVSSYRISAEYQKVSAELIVHVFVARQEDQLRGKPWLSTSLNAMAQLSDYDGDVGEAARQAANTGVYWYTTHPNAPYLQVSDELDLERGTQSTGPPGWQPAMLTPQQPSTQYVDYRQERHTEIGRPVGMPLMVVRLDAGRHNYSSARFDGRNYARAINVIQAMLSGSPKSVGPLSELVDDVAREAYLADTVAYRRGERTAPPPQRPDEVSYEWTWPQPENVDPQKEAQSDRTELEMGVVDYGDLLAKRGQTVDGMIAKRTRTGEKLKKAGLPAMPTTMPGKTVFASHAAVAAASSDKLPSPAEPAPDLEDDEEPDDRPDDQTDDDTAPDVAPEDEEEPVDAQ